MKTDNTAEHEVPAKLTRQNVKWSWCCPGA